MIGVRTMQGSTLQGLFVEELRDLYDAERQISQALPKMAHSANNDDLRAAFEDHLQQTNEHIARLEQVFGFLGTAPAGKKCLGVAGVIKEGEELVKQGVSSEVLDAGLIATAQKVEHYEMAGYGTVRTWAKELGHNKAAKLLQDTLDEEGETDKKLTKLAERQINKQADVTRKAA